MQTKVQSDSLKGREYFREVGIFGGSY